MRNFALVLIVGLLVCMLASCATTKIETPSAPETVEVKIPYAVACVDSVPARPMVHSTEALMALGDYDFIQALNLDRLLLLSHAAELEGALAACVDVKAGLTPPQ